MGSGADEQFFSTVAFGCFVRQTIRAAPRGSGGKRSLGNLASIAFGGPDLSTIYLGTLFCEKILHMPAPVKGAEPVHWRF